MFTDQPLYRARALEPVAGINQIVMLLDAAGPIRKYKSPFYQVIGVEPVDGLGPHGDVVIWTQGAVPAGYSLPAGAPTGSIAAGATAKFPSGTIFQNGPRELTQLRWSVRPLALTGPVFDDIDIQLYVYGSVGKFGVLSQSPGFINMIEQMPEPSDTVAEPAQAANLTAAVAGPAVHPADQHNLREFFVWENNPPTWVITNNGASSLSAGTITLRIRGFRYVLAPLDPAGVQIPGGPVVPWNPPWIPQLLMGQLLLAPQQKITAIPTAPTVATGSYGA